MGRHDTQVAIHGYLGIGRDTFRAHYLSRHIPGAYGDIFGEMVALSQAPGFEVRLLGRK